MDKKTLICGSSIAVVVLVLASFSPVVGYNSVESSAKESPLFNVRTKRAINEEGTPLACEYVGKGKLLPFPRSEDRIEQLQEVVETIIKMDDSTFYWFMSLVINRIRNDNSIGDEAVGEILSALYQIRKNPDFAKSDFINMNSRYDESPTLLEDCTMDGGWLPGCFFIYYLSVLVILISIVFVTFLICTASGEMCD